jgi:hypothetical protein
VIRSIVAIVLWLLQTLVAAVLSFAVGMQLGKYFKNDRNVPDRILRFFSDSTWMTRNDSRAKAL